MVSKIFTPARKDDFPFIADWFAVCLRWLVLMGIASSLAFEHSIEPSVAVVVLLSVFWNITLTLLSVTNRRLPVHRSLNVLVDFVLSSLLFIWSGAFNGPLIWVGLQTIFSAAIYYEWRGSLLLALIITLFQTGVCILISGSGYLVFFIVIFGGLNMASGLLFGMLCRQLIKGVRRNYRTVIGRRQEGEERLQRAERHRMQMMYRMIETLSATLDYQVVLDTALDISINVAGEEGSQGTQQLICAFLLFNQHTLVFGSARGLPPSDLRLTFPAEQGLLQRVIQSAEPAMIQNPIEDPELKSIIGLMGSQGVLCLPLHRGLNSYGVMLFAHPDSKFFTADRCDLLEMISHQSVIAIQNARLYQDLETDKERIIEIQEEARKQLARELHDGPAQSMAGIVMRVEIVRKSLQRDVAVSDSDLLQISDLAKRTTQEIRTMLFTLRPLVLEKDGLVAALQASADKMRETYQQNITIEADPEVVERLEMRKQTVIFYLVEEAVNNARKHALANRIDVRLKFVTRDKSISLLEIVDDGVGFDVETVTSAYEKSGSLGMINLRERADLINGVLHLESASGKGTSVQVAIPMSEEAADQLQRRLMGK